MSRELIQLRCPAWETLPALPPTDAVEFLVGAMEGRVPEPVICGCSGPAAMAAFFHEELRPALAAREGGRAVFCEFNWEQAPSDTVLEAIRELAPEVRGLDAVDWTPLHVAVNLLRDAPGFSGGILVLAGASEARKQGEREWRRVFGALRMLSSRVGVRVIVGESGWESAAAEYSVNPERAVAVEVASEAEDRLERDALRWRGGSRWQVRGAHGIATALVSMWLVAMAGLAIVWLTLSAWRMGPRINGLAAGRSGGGVMVAASEGAREEKGENANFDLE